MGTWADQVALVTGCGSERGIGRAVALQLARRAVYVVATDIDYAGAERTAQLIVEAGGNALALPLDVTSNDAIQRVSRHISENLGRLHILINNAGITRPTKLLDISQEEWDLILATDLTGPFRLIQSVLPLMQRQGYGRIVNLTSISAERGGLQNGGHYSAAKAGVIGLTRHIARELGSSGVTCNAVAPGLIDTDFGGFAAGASQGLKRQQALTEIPLGRTGSADEVAAAICFLASPDASYITGAIVDVNGGWHMT